MGPSEIHLWKSSTDWRSRYQTPDHVLWIPYCMRLSQNRTFHAIPRGTWWETLKPWDLGVWIGRQTRYTGDVHVSREELMTHRTWEHPLSAEHHFTFYLPCKLDSVNGVNLRLPFGKFPQYTHKIKQRSGRDIYIYIDIHKNVHKNIHKNIHKKYT